MTKEAGGHFRVLPSVDRVLGWPDTIALATQHGRRAVTAWIREILAELRGDRSTRLPAGAEAAEALVVARLGELAVRATQQTLRPVINATGIVIHTNLGRAPLAPRAIQAILAAAECTNLEVDLVSGQRGLRGAAVERLCRELTGAAGALVVNNCAAATLLALQSLAAGKEVVISRGQLIEIGGSFRLPEVFRQAGVTLREVGTTNRTRIADYAGAIQANTGAILRVHPSNYRIAGFAESVGIEDLVELGRAQGVPVIDDVGSGCLYDLTRFGLPEEPIVADSIRAGADLVLCSGDKLLGGPQCGIIVGQPALVERLAKNPLARALRVDKLTLAALQGTLEIHRAGRAFDEIPVLRQLALTRGDLRPRAERLLEKLRGSATAPELFSLQEVDSAPGGGALPAEHLPSVAIAIAAPRVDRIAAALRLGSPAIFGRVQDDRLLLDLRTVLPEDESALAARLAEIA